MSEHYLYLSLIPEALVASMLKPEDFGRYLAIGPRAKSRETAIFFEVDPSFRSDAFPFEILKERCVPHPDGSPRCSVYLAIYRVLERVPISALGKLYLTTDDGRVLALERGEYQQEASRKMHLYQEFCPVDPCVASSLDAARFCQSVTTPGQPVHVPKIVFSELILRELANDPEGGQVGDLPYRRVNHLRECLAQLKDNAGKQNKIVERHREGPIHFRTIRNGFFVGSQDELAYYPMPSREALDSRYHDWWRSAETVHSD